MKLFRKRVQLVSRETVILVQEKHGPCPFLAIVNVLLLRNSKHVAFISQSEGEISADFITENLLNSLFESYAKDTDPQTQKLLSNTVETISKLQSGMDVNLKFTGIMEFEETPENSIFKLFKIPLVHGWLVDPQMEETTRVLRDLTYNQTVELCTKESTDALIASEFLNSTPSQLTVYGLMKLNSDLIEHEMYVLFRNNHFSTVVKHNGEIFMLVTDSSYIDFKQIVWEKYSDLGESVFYKGNFEVYSHQIESDRKMAESLVEKPIKKPKQPKEEEECCIL